MSCPKADGRHSAGEGRLMCQYGCSGIIANLPFRCTRVSVQDDWVFGVYSLIHNFSSSNTRDSITIGNTGCCYLVGGMYNVSTTFRLARRNDTNKINSTPRTSVDPVIRVQEGCNHTIILHVNDPDGDVVRCRWACSRESGGICNNNTGATLDPTSCAITYKANRRLGYKGVAVMIEDFSPNSRQPLSSVAFQFFVRVVDHNGRPCIPGTCCICCLQLKLLSCRLLISFPKYTNIIMQLHAACVYFQWWQQAL